MARASAIRTAKEYGKRPTAVLTGDPHWGNRDIWGEPNGKDEWTQWDFALARTVQFIADHTDQNGVLSWNKDTPRVEITADRKIDPFERAKAAVTNGKNYKAKHGEYFVPGYELRGGDWPTPSEWYRAQAEK